MNNFRHVALYIRASRDEEKLGLEEALLHHRTTLIQMCKKMTGAIKNLRK